MVPEAGTPASGVGFDTLSKRLAPNPVELVSFVEFWRAGLFVSGKGFETLSKRLVPAAGEGVSILGSDGDWLFMPFRNPNGRDDGEVSGEVDIIDWSSCAGELNGWLRLADGFGEPR